MIIYICLILLATSNAIITAAPTTHSPTRNPTRNPTRPPTTLSPTTRKPTSAPTTNPTHTPTTNPTIFGAQVRLVRVSAGTQIRLESAISYNGFTPLLIPLRSALQGSEIEWTAVEWSLNGVAQSIISSCLPIPTPLPGTIYQGRCPCLITCASVAPIGPVPLQYTSLRCCITSYTEGIVQPRSVPAGDQLTAKVMVDTTTATTTTTLPSFGIIHCNSAVERELNCQFKRQSPTYIFQCESAPIDCWGNETLGYAFGLFWNQNPNFLYWHNNQSQWGEGHYRGIASILNNKTYSRDGKLVDPITSKILNEYYWLEGGGDLFYTNTTSYQLMFVPDVLQLQPFNLNPSLLLPTASYSPDECISSINSLSLSQCPPTLTWNNISSVYVKLPGVWLLFNYTNGTAQQITLSSATEWLGVEVYSSNIRSFQNLTSSTTYTLPIPDNVFQLRFIGGSIWDLPSVQASPENFFYADTLWSSLSLSLFQEPYYQPIIPLASFYRISGAGEEGDWPFLNYSSPSLPFTINISFTLSATRWQTIEDNIINYNVYPLNTPLQLLEGGYDTAPTNLSSPTDQDYLYRIWTSHLSMRRASEESDCQTPHLSSLVFPVSSLTPPLPTQYWYQNGGEAGYTLPDGAREGGCNCNSHPFYSPALSCSNCLPGLGGEECRLPYQIDPIPGGVNSLCSAHGGLNLTLFSSVNTTILLQNSLYPSCRSLLYNGTYYSLQKEMGGGSAYIYLSPPTYIMLKGDEFFINGTFTPFLPIQSLPTIWRRVKEGGEGEDELIECISMWGAEGGSYLLNPPIVYNNYQNYIQL